MTTIEAKLADAAVAQKSIGAPNRTVFDLLKQQQSEIERALPRHMDADRFARIAMTQLRRTPALLACDAASIISSVMRLAQIGLEPDGRNAYLVPYKTECTPIVSYMGYMELARRSGQVADIYA
jgi:recombination protein RecT